MKFLIVFMSILISIGLPVVSYAGDGNVYGGYGPENAEDKIGGLVIGGLILGRSAIYQSEANEILSVLYCNDGTGGCVEKLFIYKGQSYEPLLRDDTWAKMYEKIPKDYQLHKSPPINFKDMTWERNLTKDGDPNCCPSAYINIKLDVVGSQLSVKNYDFVLERKDIQ